MGVIEHEFGKERREIARRFRRLLNLDDFHDSNVLANPLPYLERASERIFQLEMTLFEAAKAAHPSLNAETAGDTVQITKTEYEALLRCREIVESKLADLASTQFSEDLKTDRAP